MAQTKAAQHLETLIRSAFDEGRCGEYYLVDLDITPANHISVFVDGDEGVSLETCTQISRVLESILDVEPTLGGLYQLEVSSPGVSRPLKFLRQYIKHTGRTLKVNLLNGDVHEGKLVSTGHDSITLDIKPKEKKAKPEPKEIPFDTIREAFVIIQFGRIK